MATGWTISIGYNSNTADKGELWSLLKEAAQFARDNPRVLEDEVKEYDAQDACDDEQILEYCEVYKRSWINGGPLRINDDEQHLHIMASGGDPSRTMKEHVARAFCRLVIQSMHMKGIEVNLITG